MPDRPSYLGLLNAIAVAESDAYCYLTEWIKVCRDPDVRSVLSTVAAREGEHGMAFSKRINELGSEVRRKDNPRLADQLATARAECSDLEKFEALGLHRLGEPGGVLDYFNDVFKDHSIDIATGELLGRYIAEEFDSARRLRACYEELHRRATPDSRHHESLEAKVDALAEAVEELRAIVGARSNGDARVKSKARAH